MYSCKFRLISTRHSTRSQRSLSITGVNSVTKREDFLVPPVNNHNALPVDDFVFLLPHVDRESDHLLWFPCICSTFKLYQDVFLCVIKTLL
jgi:hypothetical protein